MSAESLVPNSKSEIQEFYNEKTVFVSGASGFLGKLLIEKLLRTCKGLKRIYILLREKKGKTPEDRFKEIFDIPVSIFFELIFAYTVALVAHHFVSPVNDPHSSRLHCSN